MKLLLTKEAIKIKNRALKRAAQSAVAAASKEIRMYYRIKKSDLDKQIKRQISRGGTISLFISADAIALSKFRHIQTGRGVTAYVAKGDTRRIDGSFKMVFRGAKKGGGEYAHQAVAKRMTAKRLPVREYFGPSGAGMWTNDQRIGTMQTALQESYIKTLAHELNRREVIK